MRKLVRSIINVFLTLVYFIYFTPSNFLYTYFNNLKYFFEDSYVTYQPFMHGCPTFKIDSIKKYKDKLNQIKILIG